MSSENGEVHAVFNGELYNYKYLVEELRKRKHTISFTCDSNLIPHLYEEGQAFLDEHLLGMYALCIYDQTQEKCHLIRDRVGIKPLFYCEGEFGVAFSSEAKALKEFAKCDIQEVPPGGRIEVLNSKVTKRSSLPAIWNPQPPEPPKAVEEWASLLRSTVEEAIVRQLPEEWPVAILCSGGIDSAILAKVAQSKHKHRVQAYVIGKDDSPDVQVSKRICRHFQIPLQTVVPSDRDLFGVIDAVVFHTESFEPNIVRNSLLTYLLFKRIQEDGFRVAMCGEGADELLFGYADFKDRASAADQNKLMGALLQDLHRTQLLRVDRTSMAFAIEVRVPYLDEAVVQLSARIPPEFKTGMLANTWWTSKLVLRLAFGDFPEETVLRPKTTFSCGAGFGDVSMLNGPIEQYASRNVTQKELDRLHGAYPQLEITTKERAYYILQYEKYFSVNANYKPPTVARKELRIT